MTAALSWNKFSYFINYFFIGYFTVLRVTDAIDQLSLLNPFSIIDLLLIQARPYKAMGTNINIHISNHGLYNHQINIEELFPIIKTAPYYY